MWLSVFQFSGEVLGSSPSFQAGVVRKEKEGENQTTVYPACHVLCLLLSRGGNGSGPGPGSVAKHCLLLGGYVHSSISQQGSIKLQGFRMYH